MNSANCDESTRHAARALANCWPPLAEPIRPIFPRDSLKPSLQIQRRSDLEVHLIVGPANPRFEALRQIREQLGIACELVVDPPNMASEMIRSDLAVTAAGSTCWELAVLGVPALLVIVTAENQARFGSRPGSLWCGNPIGLGSRDCTRFANVRNEFATRRCCPAAANVPARQGTCRRAWHSANSSGRHRCDHRALACKGQRCSLAL